MTPKLRTHCATTLAALVLALPVATYAYAESPPAHAGESRGDGGGQGRRTTGGGDGRHDGPRRDDGTRPAGAREYGGGGDASTRSGRPGHREGAWYGGGAEAGTRSGHHTGGGVHGRSRGQAEDADAAGPGRPAHGHGSPAHGAPAAPRITGSTAAGPGPGKQGDRPPAAPRRPGEPHTPPLRQKAAERPTPSPTSSLAGRQAGQGRLRPGRTVGPSVGSPASPDRSRDGRDVHDGVHGEVHDHGHDDGYGDGHDDGREPDGSAAPDDGERGEFQPLPDPPATSQSVSADDPSPAAAGESPPYPVSQPLERQVPSLTLGAGCALMGLGLGYMGLRLRRR
ncbi:hypothetical protein AB0J25_10625 [Streptomyces sp. NPDC049910]|uniref:hypothetical protein n=1 Tax=Streptomyces sp. NPDC049910 TaxID=3155278 RepID=UPI00342DB018